MYNRLKSIWQEIILRFSQRTLGLLALLLLVAAIPLTVFIAQQQQEVRQRAEECSCGSHEDCTHNNDDGTCAETVTVCNSCDNGTNGGNSGNNDNGNNNRSDGSSGGSDRSSDGQSLSSQSPTTQRDFRSKYCGDPSRDCPEARRAWVQEHEGELSRSTDNNPNNDPPSGECSEGDYKRTCTGQRENCVSSGGEAEIYRCESGKWVRKNNECRSECSVAGRGGYFLEGQAPGSDTPQSSRQSSDRSTASNPPAQNPSGGYCYGSQWCFEDTGSCSEDSRCGTSNTQRCLYTDLKTGNNTCYFGECKDPNNCGFNRDCTPNEANFGVATYCPGQAPADFASNDPAKLFNFCRQSISYKSNQKVCDANGDGKYDEADLKIFQAKIPTPTPIPVGRQSTSPSTGTGIRETTKACQDETQCNDNDPCTFDICSGAVCTNPRKNNCGSGPNRVCSPGDQGTEEAGDDGRGNKCWKDWGCYPDGTKYYDPVRCDAGAGASCEYNEGTCNGRPKKCYGTQVLWGCLHGSNNCEKCEPAPPPPPPQSGYICPHSCFVDWATNGTQYCKQAPWGCAVVPNIFDCTKCQ